MLVYSIMTSTLVKLAIQVTTVVEMFMDADQIGIIFYMTGMQADELHQFTKCSHHSKCRVADSKDDESQWKPGWQRWIAATTGLIQGVDVPNVGTTIFLPMPTRVLAGEVEMDDVP